MRKIAIYDSFTEPKHRRLIDETAARAGFTVDYYAAPAAVPADKRGDYEVIYGMPKPGELKDFVNLKWFCGSFAGVDAYLDDSLYPSPEVMLSNSSGAYGVTIAEHMVMVTLMLLRHAPVYCADQAAGRWGRVLPMRSIMGSTNDELDALLPDTDILALALPATGETKGFLSAARLALLPKTAYVVNVGRGSAIDQAALLDALNHDRLAGAALDVFEQEPIPAGDPAWTAKNLLITPHISVQMSLGYTRDRNVQLFCEDLERYGRGEKLLRLVDRRIGY